MIRTARLAVLPALLVLAACGDGNTVEPPAEDLTTSQEVADLVRQRFEANIGDVDGFTVVGEGIEVRYTISDDTTGMEPFTFQARPVSDAPVNAESAQLIQNQVANGRILSRGLAGAQFGGTTTRDGRRAYVLSTDNPATLFGGPDARRDPSAGDVEMRVYVDAETFDLLEIYQGFDADSLETPVTQRLIYSDFQTTDGLTLPRTVRQVTTGIQVQDEDRMIMGGQLGMERQRLQSMPQTAERDARLAELDAQERFLREGVLEQTIEIDEVRVGAPEPFDDQP